MGEKDKVNEFILTVTATFKIYEEDQDEDEEEDINSVSLQTSLQEDETSLNIACAEVIISYIKHNANEGFSTISNWENWEGAAEQDELELNGNVTVDRTSGRFSFPFRHSNEDDVVDIAKKVVDEIGWGPDTWNCGDFGDVSCDNVDAGDWQRWMGGSRGGTSIRMYLGVEPVLIEV